METYGRVVVKNKIYSYTNELEYLNLYLNRDNIDEEQENLINNRITELTKNLESLNTTDIKNKISKTDNFDNLLQQNDHRLYCKAFCRLRIEQKINRISHYFTDKIENADDSELITHLVNQILKLLETKQLKSSDITYDDGIILNINNISIVDNNIIFTKKTRGTKNNNTLENINESQSSDTNIDNQTTPIKSTESVKSTTPIKSTKSVKSTTPIKSTKSVKSTTPIKSTKSVKSVETSNNLIDKTSNNLIEETIKKIKSTTGNKSIKISHNIIDNSIEQIETIKTDESVNMSVKPKIPKIPRISKIKKTKTECE